MIAAIAQGAGNLAGGIASGIMASKAAKQAAEAAKWQTKQRIDAYNKMLGRAGDIASQGETSFLQESGSTSPEVELRKQEILSGQAEDLANYNQQLQSSLAQQGLRGGQAATQLRRGIGEQAQTASRNINELLAQDAMQRKAQRMAYQQQKAQIGQQGLTSLY